MNEPLARRTIFAGLRQAAIDLWGDAGLAACAARMSPEARLQCIEQAAISEDMLPERYVLEWYSAAWEGPALRDRGKYNGWLNRMMDLGFGRVRKLLLSFASVDMLLKQAPGLWRHDHSHGALSLERTGTKTVLVTLRDHPYVETPLGRASVSEIYRYALALTRCGTVTSTHRVGEGQVLLVQLGWESEK